MIVSSIAADNIDWFLSMVSRDAVLHILTLYDLLYWRDRTEISVALDDSSLLGYVLVFDGAHVHVRGEVCCVNALLGGVSVSEPSLVIEPHHLSAVGRFYTPIRPLDPESKGRITWFLGMTVDKDSFKPIIRHDVRRLRKTDLDVVERSLGGELRRIADEALKTGFSFAAYNRNFPASIGSVHLIGEYGFIRGFYTLPKFRGLGLATSVCSALVEEALKACERCILWVARDNRAARRVYEKIGFRWTGHILLGFKAKRIC
ncbi:TPA: GNAT family N-acetyltransferase [Candidatus Bathyarchaeota archaeon]|nr:GNAT family N-acetyltransferase [Candidatus Bathyarchaeota archaeon]